MCDGLQIEIDNNAAALSKAAAQFRDYLGPQGVGERAIHAIDLALEEMGMNIIRYGHEGESEHIISLSLQLEKEEVVLMIEDDGRPFDPTQAKAPAPIGSIEDAPIGGLGISLVRKTVDRMIYTRTPEGNRLEVRVRRG